MQFWLKLCCYLKIQGETMMTRPFIVLSSMAAPRRKLIFGELVGKYADLPGRPFFALLAQRTASFPTTKQSLIRMPYMITGGLITHKTFLRSSQN